VRQGSRHRRSCAKGRFPAAVRFGLFPSYLFRVITALVATDLARDAQLSSANLGLLTSSYFLAAAVAQIPVGLALDRYGPRNGARRSITRLKAALLQQVNHAMKGEFRSAKLVLNTLGLAGRRNESRKAGEASSELAYSVRRT
jgi:MFS family permease